MPRLLICLIFTQKSTTHAELTGLIFLKVDGLSSEFCVRTLLLCGFVCWLALSHLHSSTWRWRWRQCIINCWNFLFRVPAYYIICSPLSNGMHSLEWYMNDNRSLIVGTFSKLSQKDGFRWYSGNYTTAQKLKYSDTQILKSFYKQTSTSHNLKFFLALPK